MPSPASASAPGGSTEGTVTSEADTCRKYVVPKLQAAGWDNEPYSIAEQRTITDGRIVPRGQGFLRKPPKRVDYLLRYRRDLPLAVVEAKAGYKTALDGVQQARQYAEMLGLKFAYATNGQELIEIDYFTGHEKTIAEYPGPEILWKRYQVGAGLKPSTSEPVLQPYNHAVGKGERYYQQIAISRIVEAIVKGQRRVLVTMATGTGKTQVSFQTLLETLVCRSGMRINEPRQRSRVSSSLPTATFWLMTRWSKDFRSVRGCQGSKIATGEAIKSREMYFAIYQSIAR